MPLHNIKGRESHSSNVICDTCGRKRKRSEIKSSFGSGDIPVLQTCIDGCSDSRQPLNSPPPLIFDSPPVPNARPDVPTALNQFLNSKSSLYQLGYLPKSDFARLGYWNTNINDAFYMGIPLILGLFNQDPNNLADSGDAQQG